MRKKKIRIFISFCLIALILAIMPHVNLSAANITFGTEAEITDDKVGLQIGGLLPTAITDFEIEINYNDQAFTFLEGRPEDFAGMALDVRQTSPGVAVISGKSQGGSIPEGEQKLATFYLQAKAPGVISLVLTKSNFTSVNGSPVPGTILRYYTLNMLEGKTQSTPVQQGGNTTHKQGNNQNSGDHTSSLTGTHPDSSIYKPATTTKTSQPSETTLASTSQKLSSATEKTDPSALTTRAETIQTSLVDKADPTRDSLLNNPWLIGGAILILILITFISKIVSDRKNRKK